MKDTDTTTDTTDSSTDSTDTKEQRDYTEVKCDYCGDMFKNNGIHSHMEYCDERPDDDDAEKESDPQPAPGDPGNAGGVEGSPNPEPEPADDPVICPNCGNRDDGSEPKIYAADANAKRMLVERGPIPMSKSDVIDRNNFICGNDWVAFK